MCVEMCKGGKTPIQSKGLFIYSCSVAGLSCQACFWPKVRKRTLDRLGLMLHFYLSPVKHPSDTMGCQPTRGYGWGNWWRFTRAPLIIIGVIVPCFAQWSKTHWQGSRGPIFIHLCDLSVRRFRKVPCRLIVDQFIDCTVWYMTDFYTPVESSSFWFCHFYSWFIFAPLKSMHLSSISWWRLLEETLVSYPLLRSGLLSFCSRINQSCWMLRTGCCVESHKTFQMVFL